MVSNGSDVSHSQNTKEENIGGRIIDVGQNPLNHFNHIYNNYLILCDLWFAKGKRETVNKVTTLTLSK